MRKAAVAIAALTVLVLLTGCTATPADRPGRAIPAPDTAPDDAQYWGYQQMYAIGGRVPENPDLTLDAYHGDFSDIVSVISWGDDVDTVSESHLVSGLDQLLAALALPDSEPLDDWYTDDGIAIACPAMGWDISLLLESASGRLWRVHIPVDACGLPRSEVDDALEASTWVVDLTAPAREEG